MPIAKMGINSSPLCIKERVLPLSSLQEEDEEMTLEGHLLTLWSRLQWLSITAWSSQGKGVALFVFLETRRNRQWEGDVITLWPTQKWV